MIPWVPWTNTYICCNRDRRASVWNFWPPKWEAWWLILCVNLPWPQGCSDIGLNIMLGMSVRVFLDKVNIWLVDWVKQVASPMCVGLIPHFGVLTRTKGWIREQLLSLPVFEWGQWFLLHPDRNKHSQQSHSQAFGFRLELHHCILWVSSLKTADHGISQLPQSHEPL